MADGPGNQEITGALTPAIDGKGTAKIHSMTESSQAEKSTNVTPLEKGIVSLEEKVAVVRSYLEKSFINETTDTALVKDRGTSRNFLLGLTPDKLEAYLGKQYLDIVFEIISERNKLLEETKGDNLTVEELDEFAKQKGFKMLPIRVKLVPIDLKDLSYDVVNNFFNIAGRGDLSRLEDMKYIRDQLITSLCDLLNANNNWQWSRKAEREKSEEQVIIEGFEKLDRPHVKGSDMVKLALRMLPNNKVQNNVSRIRYNDKYKDIKGEYNCKGYAAADYSPYSHSINFYRYNTLDIPAIYFEDLPRILYHEWGHSLDPRLIDQKDLSLGDQFRMIKEWEIVRGGEEEFSEYVMKINNPEKREEELFKSQESFAESIASFMNNPEDFKVSHPRRYEFHSRWFKKRFDGFTPTKKLEAEDLYRLVNSGLRNKANR